MSDPVIHKGAVPDQKGDDREEQRRGKGGPKASSTTYRGTKRPNGSKGKFD
ncbi:MAG: hypothetical protein KGI98_15535 [Euryarchaeota archaeon]|nr:hypothetical protein [Euryarchaeota archaeon]